MHFWVIETVDNIAMFQDWDFILRSMIYQSFLKELTGFQQVNMNQI